MASGIETAVIRLGDFQDGQEADCFAVLVTKEKGTTKKNEPFVKCYFRDRQLTVEAPLWSDNRFLRQSDAWAEGIAYRLRARGEFNARYGLQLKLIDIRPAAPEDEADGYRFDELVERSKYEHGDRFDKILEFVDRYVEDPKVAELVRRILTAHKDAFERMPAASHMHHNVTGGLVEHVWSVTRVSIMLAEHYARYYVDELNPPLNRDVVVAAAILHDIGKLRELEYHPVEAKYTTHGNLIGHILMGRDLVRETAREIGEFPEETLLLIEHAILAHHGKMQFGSPKEPATLEAMILHYADELDAKFNAVAKALRAEGDGTPFTGKIWAVDNRRFYRGTPLPPPDEDQPPF